MPLKQQFRTALTDTWTDVANGDPVGSIRYEWDATNNRMIKYKCVLYDDGTSTLDIVAGDVVGYVAATGYLAHTVTADVTDTDGVGAGIVLATVTADQTYMWIQLTGPATLNTTLTAGTTAGFALTLVGANDKTLDVVDTADTSLQVAWTIVDSTDVIGCCFPE